MKPTRRTSIVNIRDPRCGAVIPSQWTLQTQDSQHAAAEAALSAMPAEPGLLCFSLFRGLDDFTLFLLSQWIDEPARDAYIAVSSKPRAVVDAMVVKAIAAGRTTHKEPMDMGFNQHDSRLHVWTNRICDGQQTCQRC